MKNIKNINPIEIAFHYFVDDYPESFNPKDRTRFYEFINTLNRYRKDGKKWFGKDYFIQMGFGLHTGWGIEGAIGSFYKIDCSYLSPNVNLAARIETATNIFKVDIDNFTKVSFGKDECKDI